MKSFLTPFFITFFFFPFLIQCGQTPPSNLTWSTDSRNPVHQDVFSEAFSHLGQTAQSQFDKQETLKGNTATDGDENALKGWYRGKGIYTDSFSRGMKLGSIPDLHFMRDSSNPYLPWIRYSSQTACEQSKARIIDITLEALAARPGNKSWFSYLIGHAAHIIADSTCSEHSKRSGPELKRLTAVCTGINDPTPPGGCQHGGSEEGLDNGDVDWGINGRSLQFHAARKATIGYLDKVASLVGRRAGAQTIKEELSTLFNESRDEFSGYLNCSSLPSQDYPDYAVTIKTSDVDDAGTAAKVYVTVYGESGQYKQRVDTTGHNDFERNSVKTYPLYRQGLGALKSITLETDGSGEKPGWKVEYVTVHDLVRKTNKVVQFDAWLKTPNLTVSKQI